MMDWDMLKKDCFLVNIVFKSVFTKINIFTLKSDWFKEVLYRLYQALQFSGLKGQKET